MNKQADEYLGKDFCRLLNSLSGNFLSSNEKIAEIATDNLKGIFKKTNLSIEWNKEANVFELMVFRVKNGNKYRLN